MKHCSLEFHDSSIVSILIEEDCATLRLDGYVHQWAWEKGQWVGTGWSRPIRLRIFDAVLRAPEVSVPVDISSGSVSDQTRTINGLFLLPFRLTGGIRLRLSLINADPLEIVGTAIDMEALADGDYVEDLRAEWAPPDPGGPE